MKENDFTLEKARGRLYPTQTIMDVDNANDMSLLANASAQAESLVHILEKAAANIGLHVNANQT